MPGPVNPRARRILDCWQDNAAAWTEAVRDGAIASRVAVTDRAVIDAVTGCAPSSVIDIGCGEGWLVRALAARGIDAYGVDAVAALVTAARAGGGRFEHLDYAGLAALPDHWRVDLAVCNFSLIGEDDAVNVLRAMPRLLHRGGHLVVQTLPPGDDGDDGWREGSWDGFGPRFRNPAPWYQRSRNSWQRLVAEHGLSLVETREPRHPDNGRPASLLLVARY